MNTLCAEQRLKAFTILELLTGMIVSAIVLATLFTAYAIISKQAKSYQTHSAAYVTRSQLHSLLTRDVLRADSVAYSGTNSIECMINDCTVLYEVQDTCVIRTVNTHSDTLFTGGRHTEEYYLQHERDQHQP
jgi:hypothetical protein